MVLRPGIHRIPSRNCRRHDGALASYISGKGVFMISWFWNGPLVDHCGAYWWAPFGWFPGRRGGLGDIARRQYPPSLADRATGWPSAFRLACLWPAIRVTSILCHQCWQYKDFHLTICFGVSPRTLSTGVARTFHRWKLGAGMMAWKKGLLNWHWSVNSMSDKRFGHFQLEALLPHLGFSEKTLTKHL